MIATLALIKLKFLKNLNNMPVFVKYVLKFVTQIMIQLKDQIVKHFVIVKKIIVKINQAVKQVKIYNLKLMIFGKIKTLFKITI